jgi:aquaporin related protein
MVYFSYWVGPCLGAIVAAGFYKLLKILDYLTVLGPEDQAPTDMTTASTSGGAPAKTSGNQAASQAYEEEAKASGPTFAVQGAGLGDLLTHGDPANVSSVWL